ncbi:MAG: hypothetical protein H6757_00260 [Candidatus Omnitrophica bacterium]|nr:hypothetical protein [Candidatus Omnitrophota bacterium]
MYSSTTMKKILGDNLSKFFYDCGKVSFAMLVIGILTKKPFVTLDLFFAMGFTMLLVLTGVVINLSQEDS